MGLHSYQLSRNWKPKPKAGARKEIKRWVHKLMRIQAKDVSEDSLHPKREYFNYEH